MNSREGIFEIEETDCGEGPSKYKRARMLESYRICYLIIDIISMLKKIPGPPSFTLIF